MDKRHGDKKKLIATWWLQKCISLRQHTKFPHLTFRQVEDNFLISYFSNYLPLRDRHFPSIPTSLTDALPVGEGEASWSESFVYDVLCLDLLRNDTTNHLETHHLQLLYSLLLFFPSWKWRMGPSKTIVSFTIHFHHDYGRKRNTHLQQRFPASISSLPLGVSWRVPKEMWGSWTNCSSTLK